MFDLKQVDLLEVGLLGVDHHRSTFQRFAPFSRRSASWRLTSWRSTFQKVLS